MQLKSLLFIPFLSPIIFFMLIFTNTKKELSNTSESYSFQISPKETLQNTASAIDTVKTGLELGSKTVKQVDFIYDSLKDKSEKSTYETYKTLNKMDKLETLSRQQGINVLDNPEEYMKLAQELGITDYETEVKIYGDSSLGHHGYSHKEQAEIGLNLKNEDDKLKTSEDIRGTTAHELAHQSDTTNTSTESREHFSNTVGNNVSGLVSINDWLYGDGGLNNTSISTYWDNNKQSIQNNNNYVSNLDPSKLDHSTYVVNINNKNHIVQTTSYKEKGSRKMTEAEKKFFKSLKGEDYISGVLADKDGFYLKANAIDVTNLDTKDIKSITKMEYGDKKTEVADKETRKNMLSYNGDAKFGSSALKDTDIFISGAEGMALGGFGGRSFGLFGATAGAVIGGLSASTSDLILNYGENTNSYNNTVLTMSGATNINQIKIPDNKLIPDELKLGLEFSPKIKGLSNAINKLSTIIDYNNYANGLSIGGEDKIISKEHFINKGRK